MLPVCGCPQMGAGGNLVRMLAERGGVQRSSFHEDVIYRWPLRRLKEQD